MSWAIRNGEPWLCSMVADQIILHCEPETIATITILSKLSVDMIESPSLIFLHKYFLFRNALQDGLKADAAALLIDLITSELAPKKFHSVLFADLIAILNYENEVGV
ncbi:unnamed protein product [Anisakis simplex]|uniref:Nuclear pore complex protein Nup85 n=1 Tax=Anisakis simplex TaxID=6269 RepID=A0A3P6R4V4_ANISI|nr:unnamed protein product [Anisakis simplex]